MRGYVLQISEYRFRTEALGMETRYDAGVWFFVISFTGVLVVQEKRFIVAIDDDPPAIML